MNSLCEILEKDREHYAMCPMCESYFDMRDLQQVVDHQHWAVVPKAQSSHSKNWESRRKFMSAEKSGMVMMRI